ncbi:MAG: redoxin domain-containing protein [bacterium]|nr:redoxin domain-containing protein [bacterium]
MKWIRITLFNQGMAQILSLSTKLGLGVIFVAAVFAGILFWKTLNSNTLGGRMNLPELATAGVWLNSKPLTHQDLENRVVMLDIWEFTCVNCLRTLPYLKQWHETYSKDGLVIIGVHCPEFEFGKDSVNVSRFVSTNQIQYPIVLDNQYKIWTALYNRYWPRKMIFVNGKMVYDHIGEGGYEETERVIQQNLSKLNGKTYPEVNVQYHREEDKSGSFCYPRSPEIYAGYLRGRVGNSIQPKGKAVKLPVEDLMPQEDLLYVSGEWIQEEEYLKYLGTQPNGKDRMTLLFTGNEVNVVMRAADDRDPSLPIRIRVTLDDQIVPERWRGDDLRYSPEENATYLELREPRMYRILYASRQNGKHLLKLYPQSKGVEIYAFTFGSCKVDF